LPNLFAGYGNGTLNYTINAKNYTGLQLLFIDDQDGNWTDVYKKHLTCEQRREKARDPEAVTDKNYHEVIFLVC
jgi:hypothetical protein